MAEKMNVPLKKRHNYGKINGSVSSLNGTNAKPESNYEESEQQSCIEVPGSSEENLLIEMRTYSNSILLARAQKDRERRVSRYSRKRFRDTDSKTEAASSSVTVLSSSASDHDSESDHNRRGISISDTTSDSEVSDSTRYRKRHPDDSQEAQHFRKLLTEESLKMLENEYPPMTTQDRVQYWNLSSEFVQIEEEFNLEIDPEQSTITKPLRSERLQKLSYRRPTIYSTTTRKSRKNKKKKTEETPPSKKSKNDSPEESKPKKKKNIWKNLKPPTQPAIQVQESNQAIINQVPSQQTPTQRPRMAIVETRNPGEIPSAIKFRVSYNKNPSPTKVNHQFTCVDNTTLNGSRYHMIDTSPNRSGCFNCSTTSQFNSSMSMASPHGMRAISANNREEFYSYLGIDTNPASQEKTSPEPSTSAGNQQRRSLRVFIQQNQIKSINNKSNEDLRKMPNETKSKKSHSISPNNRSHHQVLGIQTVRQNSSETLNMISCTTTSHIQQRRSYEAVSPPKACPSKFNGNMAMSISHGNKAFNYGLNETEPHRMRCDAKDNPLSKSTPNLANMDENNEQTSAEPRPVRIIRRRASLLPSPRQLDQILKRYKKCFRQGYAITKQFTKKVRKTTIGDKQTTSKATEAGCSVDIVDFTPKDCDVNVVKNHSTNKHDNEQENENANCLISSTESVTNNRNSSVANVPHTNGLVDDDNDNVSVHMNGVQRVEPLITIDANRSLEWQRDQANQIQKSQIQNPLNMKNGKVLAILTHSKAANQDDILVVIQENLVSYWQRASRVLGMFGATQTWKPIGEITRVSRRDIEVPALYQNRLIDIGYDFPIYVELRTKESPGDGFRQCCLSFMYLHIYLVKADENGQPVITMECVNLDTVKGFAKSVSYIALKRAPSFLMTWTERNVNNQIRCGIAKYTIRTPNFDKIVDIFDYSYLQHDIKTLYELNDRHVIGCGDRTISMWDHYNGNLLIDFEIDLPTIGRNIGCFTIDVDNPEYMLLIQLTSNDEHPDRENVLKVMAVQTVDPYNWRTLQTHDIPSTFGQIQSIINNDNMLTISFTSGTFILLNILAPHTIYVRHVNWENDESNQSTLLRNALNGIPASNNGKKINLNASKSINPIQLFPQPNGQMVEIRDNNVMIKSIWEYFVNKL